MHGQSNSLPISSPRSSCTVRQHSIPGRTFSELRKIPKSSSVICLRGRRDARLTVNSVNLLTYFCCRSIEQTADRPDTADNSIGLVCYRMKWLVYTWSTAIADSFRQYTQVHASQNTMHRRRARQLPHPDVSSRDVRASSRRVESSRLVH